MRLRTSTKETTSYENKYNLRETRGNKPAFRSTAPSACAGHGTGHKLNPAGRFDVDETTALVGRRDAFCMRGFDVCATHVRAAEDDFQFVWKKAAGDVTLTADVTIVTPTADPHRRAALMIRRTLNKDSDYVDAVLHGSGMTALQSRDEKGSLTREVISVFSAPKRLSLVKRGNHVYMRGGWNRRCGRRRKIIVAREWRKAGEPADYRQIRRYAEAC